MKLFKKNGFNCYSCQGGFTTPCALILPAGVWEYCTGKNAQCFESIEFFQGSAIKYVERRCWVPPAGSNQTDYCKSWNNPNGEQIYCRSCKGDKCNGNKFNPNYDNGKNSWFINSSNCHSKAH
ncbi:uncharacterized protein LOC109608738 isoform X2 [Aethina tumida]|uniref:uncharacterized protein LOC109608738 isoform X2 n=1 Tax=Aethina tumida TaxID=116153 RepID=UPI0021495F10|nr:uncharacterized protein LOC109608738 isoform X2 [Aethina tumida]